MPQVGCSIGVTGEETAGRRRYRTDQWTPGWINLPRRFAAGHFPNSHAIADRGNQFAIGGKCQRTDLADMAIEIMQRSTGGEVKELDEGAVGSQKSPAVRRNAMYPASLWQRRQRLPGRRIPACD